MNRHQQDLYQYCLIGFALIVLAGISIFFYREVTPEYKIYQQTYKNLEAFRSTYTHEPPSPFQKGIKQILVQDAHHGTESVDRCVSCHVAMDLPHFSPTRIAQDVNGKPQMDADGKPLLEKNPDYVWAKLEAQIQTLPHAEAAKLERLKTVHLHGREVKMERVIQMHPLIGAETRPFEFHSLESYGCVTCHSGNGRALVAQRAHGPVFDGEYEAVEVGEGPRFLESDPANDPAFSRMYNHKPGHELIFQTTPLLAGPLVEARCVQCHQPAMQAAVDKMQSFANQKQRQLNRLQTAIEDSEEAAQALSSLKSLVKDKGREHAIAVIASQLQTSGLSSREKSQLKSHLAFLNEHKEPLFALEEEERRNAWIKPILKENFEAENAAVQEVETICRATQDKAAIQKMHCSVDKQLATYQRGKELFISQGCYACHRIAGFSRNNVGPELTTAGLNYPWYLKESIVWPQADLPSSTMPNFKLDHEEVAALMTFLMAQCGETKAISEVDHHIELSEWEKGSKLPWEEAITPTELHDVQKGQLVFATEGCASCHKLRGFESNICIDDSESAWFRNLVPEKISGSHLAKTVAENAEDFDQRIQQKSARDGILDEIEKAHPGLMHCFYPNFKFALRAYDQTLKEYPEQLSAYKDRVNKVFKIYVQHYGLGREIGPNLSWSGVWRDDEWLLGHFRNPTLYTSKSLMPVLPFDESKFAMLNEMLHKVGQSNRDKLAEVWQREGFNPSLAYEMLCSSCHGEYKQGNGPISQWIFPIPKNLRDPVFLKHLSKERARDSIAHGVKGTPMPPWGEANEGMRPVLSESEIAQLVEWLYQDIPHATPKKWAYRPEQVIEEMRKEKEYLHPLPAEANLLHAYFDEVCTPCGPEEKSYYIREEFYTAQNLNEAQQFFEMNCAMCHGKEGAGTGLRASAMVEAKPRVFTDIHWIRSQDDMQLLRAIKYGVPGTAMVAWGDQTSAVQRMQLVLFIRNLSRLNLAHEELEEVLFENYDRQWMRIDQALIGEYTQIESLKEALSAARNELAGTNLTQVSQEHVGELYLKVHRLEKEVKEAEGKAEAYQQLKALLKEEKSIYLAMGESVLAHKDQQLKEAYFSFVRQQSLSYSVQDGMLRLEEKKQPVVEFYEGLEEREAFKQKLADASELRQKQLALHQKL